MILVVSMVASVVAMVGVLLWVLDGQNRRADTMAQSVSALSRRLESASLDKAAIKEQMVRECEQRDATINQLRGDLHTIYAAIGELREPGRGIAPVVVSAAIEDLQEITTWVWPGCDYSSNGEAGDGDLFCRGCGESVAEPHRFDQCARDLRRQVDHDIADMIERDVAEMRAKGQL
jgi:hypothetical protein